jgi:hypothetical protein
MRDWQGRGSCTRSAVRSMCDVFFPNLPPALSRGLGAFPVPCGLSPPAERFGASTPQPRGAASERSLVCCGSGSGQASPARLLAHTDTEIDRPALTPLPAGRTASAPALIQLGRPPPNGRLPVCGRLFPTPPPRLPAVGPAPSWCEALQIAASPSPRSSRLSASTAGAGGGEPKWQSWFSLLWPSPPSSGAPRPWHRGTLSRNS